MQSCDKQIKCVHNCNSAVKLDCCFSESKTGKISRPNKTQNLWCAHRGAENDGTNKFCLLGDQKVCRLLLFFHSKKRYRGAAFSYYGHRRMGKNMYIKEFHAPFKPGLTLFSIVVII